MLAHAGIHTTKQPDSNLLSGCFLLIYLFTIYSTTIILLTPLGIPATESVSR